MAAERASNTVKAYNLGWSQFTRWCAEAGREPLPASSDTIQLFIAALIERGLRLHTVRNYLCGITYKHAASSLRSPMDDEVAALMRNAARELKEQPRGKAALTPHHLRRICRHRSENPVIAVRDRAMFLLGFAAGWRGGEIVSLQLGDIAWRPQGVVLYLGASKTDQKGKGRVVGVHYGERPYTCPVKALRAWVRLRGDWPGPLFTRVTHSGSILEHAVTRETLHKRLKAALKSIGVNPAPFGSHSLRIGMVSEATEAGHTTQQIGKRTGQRTSKTVEDYIRRDPAQVFRVDLLKGVL